MIHTTRRGTRWTAALCAALALTACGSDTAPAPAPPGVPGGQTPQYFTDDRYLGESVTITGQVNDIHFAGGLGVHAEPWGDESVLVLFADNVGTVEDGDTVRVTGRVKTFTYEEYAVSHGLVNEGMYERYNGEQFLDGDTMEVLSGP